MQVQIDKLGGEITQLQQQKSEAISLVQKYELEALYRSAALKSGVNQEALLNLVNAGLLPDLKVDGENVTVANQKIDDYLAQPGKEWLRNALVPIVEQPLSLPSGGAVSAAPASSANPVEEVFQSIGVFIPGVDA